MLPSIKQRALRSCLKRWETSSFVKQQRLAFPISGVGGVLTLKENELHDKPRLKRTQLHQQLM